MFKVTGFTKIPTSEGTKIVYTWSKIDDVTGQLLSQNNKGSFLVLNNENFANVSTAINIIENYITKLLD